MPTRLAAALDAAAQASYPPAPRASEGAIFLRPFRAKADADYVVNIVGGRRRRTRTHERLVNDCAAWLDSQGLTPARNAAVDLGLENPPVVIEAEVIRGSWARSIREAVGQLYEYRYFNVADPQSGLILLASEALPPRWLEYLDRDRGIGAMWPKKASFDLTPRAARMLDLA